MHDACGEGQEIELMKSTANFLNGDSLSSYLILSNHKNRIRWQPSFLLTSIAS